MSYNDCAALSAELERLRDELAAWKFYVGEESRPVTVTDREADWRTVLRCGWREARFLIDLVDRAGHVVNRDFLAGRLVGTPGADPDADPSVRLLNIYVVKTRQLLRRHGLSIGVVQTVWGVGYKVTAADALLLRRLAGEVA